MADAIREAKEHLRITDEPGRSIVKPKRANYQSPSFETVEKQLNKWSPAFTYLTETRKLSEAIIEKFQIRNTSDGKAIVFPNFSPDSSEKPCALKFLAVDRNAKGDKETWSSKDSEWHLFGWQAIPEDARVVIITEGEIDAMTIAGWGYPALSIPSGVKNDGWIDSDYDALARFDEIILCWDTDEPGRAGVLKAAPRLGLERCRIITLPHKDANEALLSGMTREEFARLVASAPAMDPPELQTPEAFRAEVADEFFPKDERVHGTEFILGRNFAFRIRNGELTIWTGFSGHGKSLMLIQSLVHDMSQGERVLVASLEIKPRKTLAIMTKQVLGNEPSDTADTDAAIDWLVGKLWLVNRVGSMKWQEVLKIMEYAARRYGITRFSVDSLLLLGIGGDDYDGQRACVSALVSFAGKFNVHVHLVAHSKKLDDESKPPSKFDVKGSGDITDLCHNGITVWRNKSKEERLSEQGLDFADQRRIQRDVHDGSVRLWKQRETGDEPGCKLWLNKHSMQFAATADELSRRYATIGKPGKDFQL
jgi:twinkle protein